MKKLVIIALVAIGLVAVAAYLIGVWDVMNEYVWDDTTEQHHPDSYTESNSQR